MPKREEEKTRVARENEKRIIDQLSAQSANLTEALNVLDDNAATSKQISSDLEAQVGVTKTVSSTLGSAVASLRETSRTTNTLLEETVNRIDSFTVEIAMIVDPVALNDAVGGTVLSPDTLQLLRDDKEGRIRLRSDDYGHAERVAADLRQHSASLRSALFSQWSFFFWLDKDGGNRRDAKYLETAFDGDNGIVNLTVDPAFARVDFSASATNNGYLAMRVVARYSIPPDRVTGFRQYRDLNGAKWAIHLRTNSGLLRIDKVDLFIGPGTFVVYKGKFLTLAMPGSPYFEDADGRLEQQTDGKYYGEVVIPMNYF